MGREVGENFIVTIPLLSLIFFEIMLVPWCLVGRANRTSKGSVTFGGWEQSSSLERLDGRSSTSSWDLPAG